MTTSSCSIRCLLKGFICSLLLLVLVLSTWVGLQLRYNYLGLPAPGMVRQRPPPPAIDRPLAVSVPAHRHPNPLNSTPEKIAPPSSSLPGPPAGPEGYVVALDFSEQLESGMFDLQQLTDLAHSWNLQVVEPYIQSSQFSFPALPSPHHRLLKLSEVYSLQDLNMNFRESYEAGYDPIIPLQGVVKEMNRTTGLYVVVLRLLPFSLSDSSCASSDTDMYINRLASHLRCTACRLEKGVVCLNTGEKNNFRQLLDRHPLMITIRSQISILRSKLVILIPKWHGIRPHRDSFFYWDPNFRLTSLKYSIHATKHSTKVQSAAREFSRSLHLTPPTLGIHIRLERLMRSKSFKTADLAECLGEVESLVRSLQQNKVNSSFLFRDYSKYGSSTCQKISCAEFANEMKLDQRFKSLGVKVQEYTPRRWELRREHGFSANVEQELLARADYLVTVGYGSFQSGIIERWVRYRAGHDLKRIFKLCHS